MRGYNSEAIAATCPELPRALRKLGILIQGAVDSSQEGDWLLSAVRLDFRLSETKIQIHETQLSYEE